MFIKSGLYYFYYILITVAITFCLLGRSKAEQYFGFLPFFSYLNFALGYLPILVGDATSQLIILTYTLYTFVYKLLINLLNTLTTKTLTNLLGTSPTHQTYPDPDEYIKGNLTYNLNSLFNSQNPQLARLRTVLFSKALNTSRNELRITSITRPTNVPMYPTKSLNSTTLLLKTDGTPVKSSYVTHHEALYTCSGLDKNLKTHSTQLNLNNLNRVVKEHLYPLNFNFNLTKNLNIANQQRWSTRNSLLTESILSNSFLITQSKKLIGTGMLSKDFTNSTLWLPSKSLQFSTAEASLHLNNLSHTYNHLSLQNLFLKPNHLHGTDLYNLNFFENSRL